MTSSRESLQTVAFGLALVLVMSTVLFVVMGLNPKNEDYGNMPWLYAGLSAAGAVALWWASNRLDRPDTGGQ